MQLNVKGPWIHENATNVSLAIQPIFKAQFRAMSFELHFIMFFLAVCRNSS